MVPTTMAALLVYGVPAAWVLIVGLTVFGVLFALNSALHSYLIVSYASEDGVSLDVGFYYMANAMGRLLGTVLSRALRHYRASGSALSVGCLILVLVPMNVGLLEPYLYRQHEFMLMWLVMLGVSIRSHLPPFVVPAPVRHESLDVNESR